MLRLIEPHVQMDFRADWVALLRRHLGQLGVLVPEDMPNQQVEFVYFGQMRRRVLQAPRSIHVPPTFEVPASVAAGVQALFEEVRSGADLNPRLSRQLDDPFAHDGLVGHWGIHHFHLGTLKQADGRIAGTKEILFARVTNEDFFVCAVFPHGRGHRPWTKFELLTVLHENWPSSLEAFRAALPPSDFPVDEVAITNSRKKNVNTVVQMSDGTVYLPPGGGVAASGIPLEAVTDADRHARWIEQQAAVLTAELPRLVDDIVSQLGSMPAVFRFRLVLEGGYAWAVDDAASLHVRLQALPG